MIDTQNLPTTIIDGLKVFTFESWCLIVTDPALPDEIRVVPPSESKEECLACDGTGEHECECGDAHTCGYCDGTGYITDDFDFLKSMHHIYQTQTAIDIARYKAAMKAQESENDDDK